MSLQEADFDHNQFSRPDAGDDKLYVKFYPSTVQDFAATKAEGRPIFKEVDFVMIQAPGDLLKTIKRPVRPQDEQRFPRQWGAYKAGGDQDKGSGTPLEQWPMVSRAQVEELRYFKVFTVEQLAAIADNVAQKFMGIQNLKQHAKDWLGKAENSKEIVALRNQNTSQSEEIEELKSSIRALSDQMRDLKSGRKAA
jgi:hypothetical protein